MHPLAQRILITESGLLVVSALLWLTQWLLDGRPGSSVGTGIGVFIGGNLVGAWTLWRERRKKLNKAPSNN